MGMELPFLSHKLATNSFHRFICFMRRMDGLNSHLREFISTDQILQAFWSDFHEDFQRLFYEGPTILKTFPSSYETTRVGGKKRVKYEYIILPVVLILKNSLNLKVYHKK